MKSIYMKLILPATLALIVGTSSCVNDLDVDPTIDKSTTMELDRDGLFTKIYANMALTGSQGPAGSGDIADIDEGMSDFSRQLWNANELPTDEAICSWGDAGIPEYNYGTWDASHNMVTCLYYRLYYGITVANFFLSETESMTDETTMQMKAEARFLRALYYAYAIDLFGNVPFLTTLSADNAPQAKRADVFNFIVEELLECEKDMKEPLTNTYGRADKAAAWLLLSRLYLNAEVYTGTAMWDKAAEYAEKVMNSGYELCDDYSLLFMGDNNANGAQNEIILPIICDGIDTQNYGSGLFLIASTHKDDMGNIGTSENWAGNRARRQLLDKFFPTSEAPTVDVAEMVAAAGDDRALFFGKDRTLAIEEPTAFTEGFSCAKFTNLYSTGAASRDPKFVDMDVPFMRLAEAYLTYAEAKTRNGDSGSAKTAIDALRKRANASTQPEYTLNDICDEWAREFYFEGRRRMDLIRFGFFGGNSSYVWEWKGGVKAGTNFSATKNVYGIPTNELVSNPNLSQNTGY